MSIKDGPGEGTWSVFAGKVVEERDAARERVADLEKQLQRQTDWYQQRFNRLRRWVEEEVLPLSGDVATRYYAIVANGSPSPFESADWRETMHGLKVERDALLYRLDRISKVAEEMSQTVSKYMEHHGPSCEEHDSEGDDACRRCQIDTESTKAIRELLRLVRS